MSVLRFLTLILLFTTLLGACGRSDLIRIRLLAPVSEGKKDHSILTETTESSTPIYTNTSSGGSLYFCLKASAWATPLLQLILKKQVQNLKRQQLSKQISLMWLLE